MALDRQKLIDVVKSKVHEREELYDGYHEELLLAVVDIIYKESLHQERATNIVVEINEIIKKVGNSLTKKT